MLTLLLTSGQATNKKFSPPVKKKDRMRYSLEELCLLSFVVHCFDSSQFYSSSNGTEGFLSDDGMTSPSGASPVKNGSYHITLTLSKLASSNLNDHSADSPYNAREFSDAINVLSEVLYILSNSDEMMSDIFVSPVMGFVCLKSLSVDGGFLPLKSVTGKLVALQCVIRLCIFFVVMKIWHKRKMTERKC